MYLPWSVGAPSDCRGRACRDVKRGPCRPCLWLRWSPLVLGRPLSSSHWSLVPCLAAWPLHYLYLKPEIPRVKVWAVNHDIHVKQMLSFSSYLSQSAQSISYSQSYYSQHLVLLLPYCMDVLSNDEVSTCQPICSNDSCSHSSSILKEHFFFFSCCVTQWRQTVPSSQEALEDRACSLPAHNTVLASTVSQA